MNHSPSLPSEEACRDVSLQTEETFVCGTNEVLLFLLSLTPRDRQRAFSTSKQAIQATLSAVGKPTCSRCAFASYVYSLFDVPQGSKDQAAARLFWMLPPGKLMTMLCSPQQVVNPLQFLWNSPNAAAVSIDQGDEGKDRGLVHLGDTLVRDDR